MASRWPRPASFGDGSECFDREGDREYMAPEILKGKYGREADIFSFGMIMLECAGNIVVPDMYVSSIVIFVRLCNEFSLGVTHGTASGVKTFRISICLG